MFMYTPEQSRTLSFEQASQKKNKNQVILKILREDISFSKPNRPETDQNSATSKTLVGRMFSKNPVFREKNWYDWVFFCVKYNFPF